MAVFVSPKKGPPGNAGNKVESGCCVLILNGSGDIV